MAMLDDSTLTERRRRAAAAWKGIDALVVIGAGSHLPIPGGQDQTYPFRVHPDYRWLTGDDQPEGVVAFDPNDGWAHFIPAVTEAERVWEGREPFDDPRSRPLSEFAAWLQSRAGKTIAVAGVAPDGVTIDPSASRAVGERLLHARRPKDASEIAIVRRAVAATAAGYAAAREAIRPGTTERSVQIDLEAAMFRAGADDVGYGTIVGSGPNSAVLHFAPSSRVIGADDLVLVDAGGAIAGYTADVTRTFAARGALSGERKALYEIVLVAERAAIGRCCAGVQWRDVHITAAKALAEGLVSMGVLRGDADSLLEREAIALFFPHGVGHMVGLGVRDAGGRLPGSLVPGAVAPKCCGVTLRVDLPIERDYLMTVEPGAYFIPALLRDRARRERFADCVDWTVVDRLLAMGIGGVRIEDNVLVIDAGCEVLTATIPK